MEELFPASERFSSDMRESGTVVSSPASANMRVQDRIPLFPISDTTVRLRNDRLQSNFNYFPVLKFLSRIYYVH